MKTKQGKEESDKSVDEEAVSEPKTRARKKASDISDEDKNKSTQDEPKSSKDPKKGINKCKAIVKKRRLGIRKTLRNKKVVVSKEKLKKVIKQGAKRGRKPVVKTEPTSSQDKDEKDSLSLIPATEIKKEPVDEVSPNSRSSSPKTAGRRVRLSSDIMIMKSVLGEFREVTSSIISGPRTSPYSMRKERSNSPSLVEGKNLRSGKPRKVKPNLLNEVVLKEQKKRSRLLSDSKVNDNDGNEDCKKMKRGRSCSRDGSEISKSSDVTESDISLNETFPNDTESKELNKKLEKSKTDLDVDIENSVQKSTIDKVPSLMFDSKSDTKTDTESSSLHDKNKKKPSLKRSTSLDSDNNNGSNHQIIIEHLNSCMDVNEDNSNMLSKTDNDTLLNARNSILTSMSKRFNSKEMSKNIRKARRGRKAAAATRTSLSQPGTDVNTCNSHESIDDKPETLESLSKEIDDLITNLDQSMDHENITETSTATSENTVVESTQPKSATKVSKPLGDNNSIVTNSDNAVKEKESVVVIESSQSSIDDSENIRLHYDSDSGEKTEEQEKQELSYKSNVATIDTLMDRLKVFEELDKRRQRQDSESKPNDKQLMVSNDVVLIPKSGAEIKPLKDIQSVRSPEKPIEKENVLSCFENNSAISIVKRDHVRKSIDVDIPNSLTLIKRNSISRKESTSSNHSRESTDAISFFEKSFGKDVTLTEIRKSVDKSNISSQVDLNQLATLLPTNPTQNIVGIVLDSKQISITPRMASDSKNALNPAKFSSRDPISRNSSESAAEMEGDKATIEIIKSPLHGIKSPVTAATPIAIKSLEALPMDTDPIAPTIDSVKTLPDTLLMTSGVTNVGEEVVETSLTAAKSESSLQAAIVPLTTPAEVTDATALPEQKAIPDGIKNTEVLTSSQPDIETMSTSESNVVNLPGPSNVIIETPESQVRKESILRTLGLLTHKAAKEAKDLKQKEKERIYGGIQQNKNKSSKSGSADYTGTLKTVIKLNRSSGDKKKYRSSLKMTFQKSKNRSGKPSLEPGDVAAEEDAFYTIERREAGVGATNDGGHRKSYSNRLNNHEAEPASEVVAAEPAKENLVIPEKASSFSIHPGRLCMDQCFYCGGKFGLYDTPCHIAQMKSSERQKKVLSNEEKLTVDSCLCDACYRHVDRRANDPSYRKREAPKHLQIAAASLNTPPSQAEKAPSPPIEEESEEETTALVTASGRPALCHTESCAAPAERSIRRKWLIKMRSNVNKVLKLKGDYPGLHTIPLCEEHYRALAPLMACSLCKRSITKHYNVHFINHGLEELNELLGVVGVPVRFSERPLLCKLCRYYCSLLTRPNKHASREIVYRRRLLQIHNIEVPPESEHEDEEMAMEEEASAGSKQKKKNKTKSKQRRSTEQDKSTDGTTPDQQHEQEPMEEDIESLISSNKIPVPGAPKNNVDNIPADMFEPETLLEVDSPVLHLDKQTELQYLLQKQNNPAQFLHKPNTVLTHKQRNKVSLDKKKRDWEPWVDAGISKPGQMHRINEKNAKRIQKLGQIIIQKEKGDRKELEIEITDKPGDSTKTIMLTDQAILEMSGKKSADINALKNKWQMSESFTQVKKNLSELSKKLTVERVPKKLSDMKYSNPVKRLETNPSISVRELFPGEEEMNLHCNVEFNNVREVTREGWEKCNTTIQYDTETKRLWGELQRPYGSQSSFLRHLVILEKYFRSGELVLAAGASPSAAAYSEATRCRLRAYDNLPPPPPTTTTTAATTAPALLDFRRQKTPGKSLLKVNQSEVPAASTNNTTATITTTTTTASAVVMPPPPPKNKQKQDGKTKKALPPELIAINTPNAQGRKKAMQNVLDNIQQLVSGVSASDPTEVAAAPLPAKPETPKEIKIAPKTEKPKKQKSSSKPWRPTLMPITEENLARIKKEPLQVAVDGRKMPSLVQVKCSDKRYHITLQDYNKMCIIRRGKLQQLQDGDKGSKSESETIVTEIPPSAVLGNGGTVKQSITIDKTLQADKPKAISDLGNAATILKSVGLKNITIAPIPAKCSATTSGAAPVSVAGPAGAVALALPKIPKSLTVIPQSSAPADARP